MVFGWFKRLKKNQALEQTLDVLEQTNERTNERTDNMHQEPSTELHKESIQLGLAAGYTGRSIHDINSSLNRIESILPSKEWLLLQLGEHFDKHEQKEQKRTELLY